MGVSIRISVGGTPTSVITLISQFSYTNLKAGYANLSQREFLVLFDEIVFTSRPQSINEMF